MLLHSNRIAVDVVAAEQECLEASDKAIIF